MTKDNAKITFFGVDSKGLVFAGIILAIDKIYDQILTTGSFSLPVFFSTLGLLFFTLLCYPIYFGCYVLIRFGENKIQKTMGTITIIFITYALFINIIELLNLNKLLQ